MNKESEIGNFNLKLQKYYDKKSYIKIQRTICGEEDRLSGFIAGISEQFLLLHLDFDFMLDGFAIIKKDDFDSIRHSSYERTQRKIFNEEGLLDEGFGFDIHLPLTTWEDIFKTLKKYDYHAIVKNLDEDFFYFWIGEIKRVTDKSVSIHHYDANGILDNKPSNIKFDTIRTVMFGDRYSTTFRKYLKAK